ncbi:glycosyltransferase family 2 protein [Candidatus Pelagibacter bacterium nBUS_28]|jgi:dolichol-phosphate mannosyltransferase|uniref:glycosyltransferase family 2 protein n=1 Tax=Candidatus Pelagibacter bacterium nBUS_28 TaxID=3374189 RepID=UPI003EBD81C1
MILILLPAFNEEKSLPQLINKLEVTLASIKENYRIIICNDGSTDKTQEILEKYSKTIPLEIIQHKVNRGLGETIRDLFERAATISSEDDIIIRFDCDDTHEPKYISLLINKIRSGYDVVTASRFEKGGGQHGVNIYRSFISKCANLFMSIFFPITGIKDYSCGYRAYNPKIIKKAISFYANDFIQLKGLGFTCTLEKLVKLKIIGARFGEIPFELRYDQKVSDSKMVSSITTLGYIVMTILYHWPFGGWKNLYKKRLKKFDARY